MTHFTAKLLVLLSILLGAETWAFDFSIDNTCTNCPRRQLDSLNVFDRRPIRVNQVGFRTLDSKKAFVANPKSMTFQVINSATGVQASSGSLTSLGVQKVPPMWVNGAFNSITAVYSFGDTATSTSTENLYQAEFDNLSTPGTYYVVVGSDTSATFRIDDEIFNSVFETSLKFFGAQRCGDTHSWLHEACHLQDGSAVGHDLTGGWHDCGDHFKASETLNYAAFVLAMTYTLFPEKAEDHYGASYNDTLPYGADGIPDLLNEAKVGADFIFKLYKASKADGLIAKHDMYHSVGVASADHQFWDVPEHQDAQPPAKGGAPRVVAAGIGGNVAGGYAATLALFSYGWELFNKPYADSLLAAAIDMYDNVVFPNRLKNTDNLMGFYPGGNSQYDDYPAAAALALFYVTKDQKYFYDLAQNKTINNNASNAFYNCPYFPSGYFGSNSGFYPGGWMTDYENVHSYVMYAFAKLILPTTAVAAQYGISATARDSLLKRTVCTLGRTVNDGTNGAASQPFSTPTFSGSDNYNIHYDQPYHDVWTSEDWGFNRYNMGAVVPLFMMWDLTGNQSFLNIGLDNFYYNMGMNPWDISFIMGTGDKNLQHPHNRAANPDGYNAGGFPYEYHCPKGALMGGANPSGKQLKDDWSDYTSTETCIDFSAQMILPAQMLAKDLPPVVNGPVFSNVVATPISNTSVLISWQSDELAQGTVYLSKTANGTIIDSASNGLSKNGSVQFDSLTPGATYYFYLQGMDIHHNVSTQDNHGDWFSFTMTVTPAQISTVRICQVDDQNASIYWWTANTASNSTVKYGTDPNNLSTVFTGDQGQPVLFHDVELTGLKPGTQYYFDVVSGATTDNNGGAHYTFTTNAHAVYLNYSVYTKAARGSSTNAYFEFDITNNESKPYQGLEVRWYYSTQTIDPSTIVAHIEAPQRFDGSGMGGSLNMSAGSPVQVGTTKQWYIPFTILDTIVVSGRAHFNAQIASYANYSNYGPCPYTELTGSWSLAPHVAATDPVYFTGVNLAMGLVDKADDQVETINGVTQVMYVNDSYISLYYQGAHIFGYPPDYANGNAPVQRRNMNLLFTTPVSTPQVSETQQAFSANFTGTGWVKPAASLSNLELNALDVSSAMTFASSTRQDSMTFAHTVDKLNLGANREEFALWYNANANKTGSYDCACAYQRLSIQVDTIVTPRVKRLLQFSPFDTVQFYQGKRKMVVVVLTDSTGAPATGESVTLSLNAAVAGFTFYADPTVATPIQSIGTQNDTAVFYVAYNQTIASPVVTSLQLSVANPNATYSYVIKDPVLIANPPPPWPIISSAKMIDTDCDQIPDAIDIQLTGNFQAGTYDFSKVTFVYESDTLTSTDTSNTTASSLRVHFKSPSGKVNTNPTGPITLYVNVAGQGMKTSEESYSDGIGPVVTSVSILEKQIGAPHDTLYVQYSEPVNASTAWPFLIFDAQGIAIADTPSVYSAQLINTAKNIWAYALDSVGGKQPVAAGVQLQLKNGAPVTDLTGNTTDACSFAKLTVSIKRHPIPLMYAAIADTSGDGIADHVIATFVSAVDSLHEPDSISTIFGFFSPETLTTSSWTWDSSRTVATLALPRLFKLGNTAGTFKGTYQGGQLVNAGQVTQLKGLGADFESTNILAEDKTGPVILSATYGEGRGIDTLHVAYSEPVTQVSDTAGKVLLLRERGGNVALIPVAWRLSTDGTSAVFYYLKSANSAVTEGDRVRFDPAVSRFSDVSGNLPSINNPWVTVGGSGSVNVTVDITMQSPVTKSNNGTGYGQYQPKSDEPFRITVLNPTSGTKDILKNGRVAVSGIDTSTYQTQGPTFLVSLGIPRGSGFGDPPVWDSVQVKLEIMVYSNLGGYVNKVEQTIMLRNGNYYDMNNEIQLQVEWTNQNGKGPVSQQGRAVGSGAYVGRSEVSTLMYCNKTGIDPKVRARFNQNKSSNSSTWLFGYSRQNK